jgi:hypothetical protein
MSLVHDGRERRWSGGGARVLVLGFWRNDERQLDTQANERAFAQTRVQFNNRDREGRPNSRKARSLM